jgi:hypothetical protein
MCDVRLEKKKGSLLAYRFANKHKQDTICKTTHIKLGTAEIEH